MKKVILIIAISLITTLVAEDSFECTILKIKLMRDVDILNIEVKSRNAFGSAEMGEEILKTYKAINDLCEIRPENKENVEKTIKDVQMVTTAAKRVTKKLEAKGITHD